MSTLVVGFAMWWVLPWLGVPLPLLYCLIFGALISPTDPIAVIGILKSAGAPRNLELVIAGESLFNDGVGVVLFALLVETLVGGETPTVGHAALLLLQEAGGGILFGLVAGLHHVPPAAQHRQLPGRGAADARCGDGRLCARLAPARLRPAGDGGGRLMIGNQGRALAMSDTTRHHIDLFWELLDEILNAVLFVLIGLEVIVIRFAHGIFGAALAAIAVTLFARWLTVGLPVALAGRAFKLPAGSGKVLTWGGLRGGISVALCLSLPLGPERETLLAMTYCVVAFSILGQGLTVGRVVKRAMRD